MKEQRINFETAKLAKEKRFDWLISGYYVEYLETYESDSPAHQMTKGEIEFINEYMSNNKVGDFSNSNYTMYSAPTQSRLQKWLRDVHSIYVTALPFRNTEDGIELCWYYSLVQDSEELDDILCNEFHLGASDNNYQTYEEALEAGLQVALNYLTTDI